MLVSNYKSTLYYNVEDQHWDFIYFFILFYTLQACAAISGHITYKILLYSQEQNFTLCLKGY